MPAMNTTHPEHPTIPMSDWPLTPADLLDALSDLSILAEERAALEAQAARLAYNASSLPQDTTPHPDLADAPTGNVSALKAIVANS